jgi:hypothetical protein
VLILTDQDSLDLTPIVKPLQEVEKLPYASMGIGDYKTMALKKEWLAIVLVFDSQSEGLAVAREFREDSMHEETPIVYYQPSPMTVKNLSVVHSLEKIATATGNVLRTRAEPVKKSA